MLRYIEQYRHPFLPYLILFFAWQSNSSYAFTSKWDRVDSLARAISSGSVASRLQAKDEMLKILVEQEADYPIVYVDINATGANNGESWQNAFTDIQPAIDKAAEKEGWVWVAQGAYWGTYPYTYGAIRIESKVMLFGGFTGHEIHINERNPKHNITTIRGWNGRRAVEMMHRTLIDGFTIRDSGYRTYSDVLSDDVAGGGIRTRSWLSIIRNNIITGNWAKSGGGIAAWNRENTGMENVNGYVPIIDRNIITDNQATCGAGVNIRGTEALFCNNIVYKNHDDDPAKSKGIEIHIRPDHSDRPIIVNSIIWGHRTGQFNDIYNHVDMVSQYGEAAKARLYYNCIENGGYGDGLITADPQFIDADAGDFDLGPFSPCVDAGHPDGPLDADGTRADIGFFQPLQYLLTIDLNGVPAIASGSGWHNESTQVQINVDSLVMDPSGQTRYRFLHWDGGNNGYSGNDRNPLITMNSDITQIASWETEHKITISTGTELDKISGWYIDGTTLTLSINRIHLVNSSERTRFLNWIVDGTQTYSTDDTTLSLKMTSGVTIGIEAQTEYRLEINTPYSAATGQGWYAQNQIAMIVLENRQIEPDLGHRIMFSKWEGNYTGNDTAFSIEMTGPVVQTAIWQEQFLVNIQSDFGNPLGDGWTDAGSTITFSVDSLVTDSNTHRLTMKHWIINGTDTVHFPSFQYGVNNPLSAQIDWKEEYWIALNINPPGMGSLSPYAPPGIWFEKNQSFPLLASGNNQQGYGFANWDGLNDSLSNPAEIVVTKPFDITANFEIGNITIDTDPAGLTILADGALFTAPQVFYWLPGDRHEISTISHQQGTETIRYDFESWSDHGLLQHQITIGDEPVVYTAHFDTSFFLSIQNERGLVPDEGWYEKGTMVNINIDSTTQDSSGVRQRFTQWQLMANDTSIVNHCGLTLVMIRPYTLLCNWQRQIQLQTRTEPAFGGHIICTPQLDWYDIDMTVQLEAVPVDTNFTFSHWLGILDSTANPLSQTFSDPMELVAVMTTETAFPPQINGIDDMTLLEDDTIVWETKDLANYISDENDAISTLTFQLNANHFELNWNGHILTLIPKANWSGTDHLILTVVDPYHFEDSDTFNVTVYPVPDKPGDFDLLYPPDNFAFPDTMSDLTFQWSQSLNVDMNDQIRYTLYLDSDTTFDDQSYSMACGSDTMTTLNNSILDGIQYWRVQARDAQGLSTWSSGTYTISFPTLVEVEPLTPKSLVIYQNYPNPFNGSTKIEYALPEKGNVILTIYDVCGQIVQVNEQRNISAGSHSYQWNGENRLGHAAPSGIYFVTLRFNGNTIHRKMSLIR